MAELGLKTKDVDSKDQPLNSGTFGLDGMYQNEILVPPNNCMHLKSDGGFVISSPY